MKQSMKRQLWILALALLAAELIWVNLPEKTIPTGTDAGEQLTGFRISCLDGGEFVLSDQAGKVVVINIWATWCSPCVQELPHFDRLQREFPEEVAVLALHAPPITTNVTEFLSSFSYEIPFAVDEDGSLCAALKASAVLPQTVILSPNGIVTYNQPGALSYEELTALVAAAKGT